MRLVKFPLVYIQGTSVIDYPDSINKFSDVEIIGQFIKARYSGSKSHVDIPDYIYEENRPTISLVTVAAKNSNDADLVYWDQSKNFLSIPAGVPFIATGTISNMQSNETWNTPVLKNGQIDMYFITKNVGNVLTLKGKFVNGGKYKITQDGVNEGFDEPDWFLLETFTAKVSS